MLTCPLCKKKQPQLQRECPSCHADLTLLIGYVENLAVSLARAELLTRKGQLADAVFAYLEVLDVDPENPIAKQQVGQVATAVRHFDSRPPGKRRAEEGWGTTIWLLIVLGALLLGCAAGMQVERWLVRQHTEEVRE